MMGEIVVVPIERMGQAGDGVARAKDGRLIFIAAALPGEVVRAEIIEERRNFVRAHILQILEGAADRESPPCPLFDECGGCTFQHWNYASELRHKETRVREALRRLAGISDDVVGPIIGSRSVYGYRNKGQFPAGEAQGRIQLGLYRRGTHEVIPTNHCAIQDDVVNQVLEAVQRAAETFEVPPYDERRGKGVLRHVLVRSSRLTGEALVLLVVPSSDPALRRMADVILKDCPEVRGVGINVNSERTNRILGHDTRILRGQGTIMDTILGLKFRVSFTSFFQVNPGQVGVLYETALGFLDAGLEEIWDLYSGVGTLAALAAQKARQVRAIEANRDASEDARENFRLNDIHNVTMVLGRVEEEIDDWIKEAKRPPDAVIVDPPRSGLTGTVIQALRTMGPQQIVYISCNPDTWARDVQAFEPIYQLTGAVPVDMFPRTDHVEVASILTLR